MDFENSYNENGCLGDADNDASFHLNSINVNTPEGRSALRDFDESFMMLKQAGKLPPPPLLTPSFKVPSPPSPICHPFSAHKNKVWKSENHTTSTPYNPAINSKLPSKEGNLRKILFDRSVRKEVDVMDTSVGNSSHTGIANISVDDVINDVKNNKNDDTKNINNKSNNHDTHSTSHSNKENINSNNNLGLNVSDVFMTSYREGDSALMGDSLHHHSSPSSSSSSLPLCKSQHADLNSISHDTMGEILEGGHGGVLQGCIIIDCRYPYEFQGGHIRGAINISNQDQLLAHFFSPSTRFPTTPIIIFHCEFSAERAPKMMRHMRNTDRSRNHYPHLCYPHIFLLYGGYSLFFRHHSTLCEPRSYVPMAHESFKQQMRLHHNNNKQLQQLNNKITMEKNISIFHHNNNNIP